MNISKTIGLIVILTSLVAFADGDLIRMDVSGKKGADGQDGHSYTNSAGTDRNGARGGDAGPAERGQDAGNISVRFKSGPNGTLEMEGTFEPAGRQPQKLQKTLKVGKSGYIPMIANGGEGGRGGDGGQGQDGGRGSDGSDATEYSSGSDGEPGGDGGDGGNATSGKRGGDGGKIHVRVSDEDTHLIMLVHPQVKGGEGGRAGVNGQGGSGGRGGSGGSSHSWTETHTRSVTNSDGSTGTETYTTSHSNPGGSDGPRGRNGRDGNAQVTAGARGPEGEFRIIVRSANGQERSYAHRYDMEIIGFEANTDNNDGIFEPGEKATVRNLRVKNTGGMPTPPNHPVKVYLGSSEWVVPEGVELNVPKSLEPGEEYVFEKEVLPFQIPDTQIVSMDKAFERTDHTNPLAYQSAVDRPYTNFTQPHEFTVQFPIKIQPVRAVETLARGDLARMDWKVTNISGRDFGGASDLKREIATLLGMGNHEQMGQSIVLMDADGNPLDWNSGLLQEVSHLKAGESTVVKGMMGILPNAESYAEVKMQVNLELGKIHEPDKRKLIQQNNYPVRIGERYNKSENSDILLVTNHGTTQDEIEAWRRLAERSGKKLDVWDVSLNNFLDLDRSIIQGENLLKDFHGKTIVILNNKFKTVEGEKHGDELMGQMDLIRATASHGVRILVVNENGHTVDGLMSDRLIPTDKEVEYGYRDLTAYLAGEPDVSSKKGEDVQLTQIFKPEFKDPAARRKEVKLNPTDTTGQIPIVGYRRPNKERLAAQAARVQATIEARNPGARVVVAYDVAQPGQKPPAYAKQKGWFGDYKHQGTLTIRPTVNEMQPNIMVIDAPSKVVHNPAFVEGEGMNAALVQAFNFEDKLSALDKVLGELAETPEGSPEFEPRAVLGRKLVDAILVDLAVEQASVLRHGWKSGLSSKTLRESLHYLNRIGNYQTNLDLSKPSPAADLMADLVAGIQFLGKNQARWYERLPFLWAPFRRGPAVSAHTNEMAEKLGTEMFGPPSSHSEELAKHLRDRIQELTQRRNKLYSKKGSQLSKKQAAAQATMQPLLAADVTIDALYTFNRVLSQEDWDQIHRQEASIEEGRRELQKAKEKQKEDYLVVNDGQLTDPQNVTCAARFLELVKQGKTGATGPVVAESGEAPAPRPAF